MNVWDEWIGFFQRNVWSVGSDEIICVLSVKKHSILIQSFVRAVIVLLSDLLCVAYAEVKVRWS